MPHYLPITTLVSADSSVHHFIKLIGLISLSRSHQPPPPQPGSRLHGGIYLAAAQDWSPSSTKYPCRVWVCRDIIINIIWINKPFCFIHLSILIEMPVEMDDSESESIPKFSGKWLKLWKSIQFLYGHNNSGLYLRVLWVKPKILYFTLNSTGSRWREANVGVIILLVFVLVRRQEATF